MADPKALLNTGLGIIEREMTRLEVAARKDSDDPLVEGGLSSVGSEKLCSYMSVLRQLIDKDLGGENVSESTEEELNALVRDYAAGAGEGKGRRGRRSSAVGSGGQ